MISLSPFGSWSLKTKFALCSGALMFGFSVLFTSWTLHTVQAEAHASVVDAQLALVQSTAHDIDDKVELRRDALTTITLLLEQAAPGNRDAMDNFFRPRPVLRKMFEQVAVVDAAGQLIYDAPSGAAAAALGAGLPTQPFFQQLRQGAALVISPPIPSARDGVPMIAFGAPLHSPDGRFTGALLGLLSTTHGNFLGDLGRVSIGQHGFFILVERSAHPLFVLHRERGLIGTPAADTALRPLIEAALQGRDGSVEDVDSLGVESLRTFTPLRRVPWALVADYPAAEAFAGLRQRRHEVLAVGLVLFVLASAAAWLVTRQLLRPLGRLQHWMALPKAGPGLRLAPHSLGSAELAALAQAYHDQSDRRSEFELRLQASEQRLRDITDHLPALIAHLDRHVRYDFLNATFQTWLGIDPAAAVGKHMQDVLGRELYAARRDHIGRCLAGESISFEMEASTLVGRKSLRIDYLPDIGPDGSVQGFYSLGADVTALKDAQRSLDRLVRSDSLTGLFNRLQLEERLPLAIARRQHTGLGLTLMFLDIDHFKRINDRFGHAMGDRLLREFALRLQRCVRSTDTVARLGGDEFVIVLEGLHTQAEPIRVARSILDAVRAAFDFGQGRLQISTSIGVTWCGPTDTLDDTSALLRRADEALYAAKAAGRDRYHLDAATFESAPAGH
jgi:diguanylate cyclase (GGDEF)-like protein/PAS domain S-box-containing protein